MELWIGKDAVFSNWVVLLITVYLYLMGMRQSVFMARSSAGLYRQDRWFAIGEAVINLVLSLIFIQFWGVIGIVAANIISLLAVPFWTQPRIVYRHVLNARCAATTCSTPSMRASRWFPAQLPALSAPCFP